VLHERLAVAQRAAALQGRIHPVEDVQPVLQLAQPHLPQLRPDHPADVHLGRGLSVDPGVSDVEPRLDQRVDGGRQVGMALGLHLGHEPVLGLAGLDLVRVGLLEVLLLPVIGSLPA
jgi:hypothetical protein